MVSLPYLIRRLLLLIPMLLGITVVAFIVSHVVPGDPAAVNLGQYAMSDPTIVAAFRRQWGLDKRLTDLIFAFPTIILAMAVAAALGPGLQHAVIAIAGVWRPSYARLARSMVLGVSQEEYVTAARAVGLGTVRLVLSHILRNAMGPIVVLATLDVGNAILTFSGLSFLGLGATAPAPEWGSMVSTGAQELDQWWLGVFPGLAIWTVVLAFNLLGDGLRDTLDPRGR